MSYMAFQATILIIQLVGAIVALVGYFGWRKRNGK